MKQRMIFCITLTILALAAPARAATLGALAVSPDGKELAAGDRMVWLQNVQTGEIRKTFQTGANTASVLALRFSPDGKALYAGDGDGGITEYPVAGTSTERIRFKGNKGAVNALAISADGKWLYSGGDKKLVTVWDLATRSPVRKLEPMPAEIRTLALSPAGDRLAVADDNGRVVIWNCASWQVAVQFDTGDTVNTAVFSADGSQLITGGNAEFVQFWSSADGKKSRQIPREGSWVSVLALSPDGLSLAAGGGLGEVRVWNLASGKRTDFARHAQVVTAGVYTHESTVTAILFTPDGARLITGGEDNAIHNTILTKTSR